MTIINNLMYEKSRTKYLKKKLSKIGPIEEFDDCIICYVKPKMLEKNSKKVVYNLNCNGMNTIYEKERKLVNYYKLNKPIYYIFDSLNFDTIINISSLFSTLIFRNCTFNDEIRISWAENIVLENNIYNCCSNRKDYGNDFFSGTIKNLIIKNEQFINSFSSKYNDNNFGININAERIIIHNSDICSENHGQFNVKCKEIDISSSKISAPEIYLDADSIKFSKSLLKTEKGIIIENKKCDYNKSLDSYYIISPYTVYNGEEIITNYNKFKNEELKEQRLTLVKELSNVLNKTNQNSLVKFASIKK